MQIVLILFLLTLGGLLNLAIRPRFKLAYNLALGYIFTALLISISSWLFYCSSIKNNFFADALPVQLKWIESVGQLMLGYLVVNIFIGLTSHHTDDQQTKKIIVLTLWGISVLTGFGFIVETFWKAENPDKMICFFNRSGYSVWFLYFIMIAEALGGLGILLHYKLKTGPFAAAGLMLIMIGALYTHCHNNDPFSDSYPAIAQFITLALTQAIYYFEQSVKPQSSDFSFNAGNRALSE